MIQTVIKRDGRVVGYNEEKIKAAIRKAMLQTEKGEDESLIQKIADRIGVTGDERMTVEEIQDRVELELMSSPRKEVAKRYIAYRDQRSIARRAKVRDMFLEIIEAKNNDITRENANMNTDSPAGMMMKFASETTKPFVDDYLLTPEAREAVRSGYLHIHDKDYYPTKSLTCVQHPLDRILNHGFAAGHSESRPAKRIETASVISCISMETAQNEMHGGQAIPAFDFYLAPFVRSSYQEELKKLETLTGENLSDFYDEDLDDYITKPLDGLTGEERLKQHAINQTVMRVHQSMEAFIHKYEHHPFPRWQSGCIQLYQLWHRYLCRGPMHYQGAASFYFRRCRKWCHSHLSDTDLEEEKRSQLPAGGPQLRPLQTCMQSYGASFLPKFC